MNLIDRKLERLDTLRKQRPQFSEIYDFYSGLCRFFKQHQDGWLQCHPDLTTWPTRRQAGFPLLTAASLQIDEAAAADFLQALISSFIEHGQQGEEALRALSAALGAGAVTVEPLFAACLERDRAPLASTAEQLEIPAALLEYVCATALASGLQQWRQQAEDLPLDDWQEGFCPVCGGAPAMGELTGEEGTKQLHCSICACQWTIPRLQCSSCGNTESDSLAYFTAEGEAGYRVDICRKCSSYLKVVDSRELGGDLPMDVEDLNTMHLDLLAQKEGFAKGKRNLKE